MMSHVGCVFLNRLHICQSSFACTDDEVDFIQCLLSFALTLMSSVWFWLTIYFFCYYFQASHLETETISYEEKEQQLVNDCVKELRTSHVLFPVKPYVVETQLCWHLGLSWDDCSCSQVMPTCRFPLWLKNWPGRLKMPPDSRRRSHTSSPR